MNSTYCTPHTKVITNFENIDINIGFSDVKEKVQYTFNPSNLNKNCSKEGIHPDVELIYIFLKIS